GSYDTIVKAAGDYIDIASGTGDTVTGTGGFFAYGGSGVGFGITGTADTVYAGLNDSITDGGAGTDFAIERKNVGALALWGFGSDVAQGVIDLQKGVGGYTSPTDAWNHLTSDNHGGSLLSLAATGDGSIDFFRVAKSSLSPINFAIS
ncbi:MAG: hypothetical protein JO288_00420, partial [Hyphomicrobiales bacterium]|nr:hypothetical protein [Hyphomicrobiales bacterium]